jgi:molybdopterin-guanine dinucleotide biosynthesis protein A
VSRVTTDRRLEDCTGVLVAGGQGTRLGGIAKGLLTLNGETIAARSVALFRALFADVIVVANAPAPYRALGVRIEPDRIGGKGAPGGLHAALSAARTPWVFTAGCDMPFLEEASIRSLAARRCEGELAVVPMWKGVTQPLHALWSRAALPIVERMITAGDPSLRAIVRGVGARIISEQAWAAVDPTGRAFENANTAEDLVRLGLAAPPPRR